MIKEGSVLGVVDLTAILTILLTSPLTPTKMADASFLERVGQNDPTLTVLKWVNCMM